MPHENAILDLILSSEGKNAPFMTEKLCEIGDGKMAEGISNLTKYAVTKGVEIGKKSGFGKGVIFGTLCTLTVTAAVKIASDYHRIKAEQTSILNDAEQSMKSNTANADSMEPDEG